MSQKSLLTEKELIELCKRGDRRAHMQIYDKYSRAMYNVAYRFMNDSDMAQDMMQDGFIKAFSKLESYSGEVIFGGWLKRIIVNTCLDEIRKKKDIVSFDDAKFLEPVIEVEDNIYDSEELYETVKSCINNLPEKYKVVVNLFLIEGYDYDEISTILDVKSSTARSLVSRAKIKLKQTLGGGDIKSLAFTSN